MTCFEFNHNSLGAIGSYITMPPSDSPMTISELYDLIRLLTQKEWVIIVQIRQKKLAKIKNVILHDITNDTFIIGNLECRSIK